MLKLLTRDSRTKSLTLHLGYSNFLLSLATTAKTVQDTAASLETSKGLTCFLLGGWCGGQDMIKKSPRRWVLRESWNPRIFFEGNPGEILWNIIPRDVDMIHMIIFFLSRILNHSRHDSFVKPFHIFLLNWLSRFWSQFIDHVIQLSHLWPKNSPFQVSRCLPIQISWNEALKNFRSLQSLFGNRMTCRHIQPWPGFLNNSCVNFELFPHSKSTFHSVQPTPLLFSAYWQSLSGKLYPGESWIASKISNRQLNVSAACQRIATKQVSSKNVKIRTLA